MIFKKTAKSQKQSSNSIDDEFDDIEELFNDDINNYNDNLNSKNTHDKIVNSNLNNIDDNKNNPEGKCNFITMNKQRLKIQSTNNSSNNAIQPNDKMNGLNKNINNDLLKNNTGTSNNNNSRFSNTNITSNNEINNIRNKILKMRQMINKTTSSDSDKLKKEKNLISLRFKTFIENNYIPQYSSPNVLNIYRKINNLLYEIEKNYYNEIKNSISNRVNKDINEMNCKATTIFILGLYGSGKEILLENFKNYYLEKLEKSVLEQLEDTITFDPYPFIIVKEDNFPELDKEYQYPENKKNKKSYTNKFNKTENNLNMNTVKSFVNVLLNRERKNLSTVFLMEGDSQNSFIRFFQETLERMNFKREFIQVPPLTERKFEDLIKTFLRENSLSIRKQCYYDSMEKIMFECNSYNINKLIMMSDFCFEENKTNNQNDIAFLGINNTDISEIDDYIFNNKNDSNVLKNQQAKAGKKKKYVSKKDKEKVTYEEIFKKNNKSLNNNKISLLNSSSVDNKFPVFSLDDNKMITMKSQNQNNNLTLSKSKSNDKIPNISDLNTTSNTNINTNTNKTNIIDTTLPHYVELINEEDLFHILGKIFYNKRYNINTKKVVKPLPNEYRDHTVFKKYFHLPNLLDFTGTHPSKISDYLYTSLPNFVFDLEDYCNILETFGMNSILSKKFYNLINLQYDIAYSNISSLINCNLNQYNPKYFEVLKKRGVYQFERKAKDYSLNVDSKDSILLKRYIEFKYYIRSPIEDLDTIVHLLKKLKILEFKGDLRTSALIKLNEGQVNNYNNWKSKEFDFTDDIFGNEEDEKEKKRKEILKKINSNLPKI